MDIDVAEIQELLTQLDELTKIYRRGIISNAEHEEKSAEVKEALREKLGLSE